MTGKITLRGKVLPVGEIREKILAARRAHITNLVLCEQNERDIKEIKEEYLKGLTFHYVSEMKEVLDIALTKEKVKNPKIL
jgi:ATP-dependent Lon protease